MKKQEQKSVEKNEGKYDPSSIESKWQEIWEKTGVYKPDLDKATKPFFNLMMFPYPSAEGMHVGNMYAFTGSDIYGRFKRMQGYDVFEPIGLDGFGIHSENYALKTGRYPKEQAKLSEANFYRQLRATGNGFDWSRTVETYDPDYYRWTQWIFIQLFKAGLAYRKKSPVNYCPSCKTVLADEQVINKSKIKNQKSKIEETVGVCERCDTPVEKRDLEQWFFRITNYAERLLKNTDALDWSEKVKIAQKQWIGKSKGARVNFSLKVPGQADGKHSVEVFTTRPDTLFGATFLVISPEVGKKWLDVGWNAPKEVAQYIEEALKKDQIQRSAEGKEKTGVFTEVTAINPVNNEEIPVWVADYVLGEYGTGAIMAVPAHDERDHDFAIKYDLEIKVVIARSGDPSLSLRENRSNLDGRSGQAPQSRGGDRHANARDDINEVYTGDGVIINSGEWNGLQVPEDIEKTVDWVEKKGLGKAETTYHLRDWLISRQRYWGPPIPLVFCENCALKIKNQKSKIKNDGEYSRGELENPGWVAITEENLPVVLPDVQDWKPLGTGKSPLANHPEFYETTCPKCGGEARRETDVSDTFLDSSWYFLRYIATDRDDMPFPSEAFSSENSENSVSQNVRKSDSSESQKHRSTEFSEIGQREKKWLPVDMYIGGAEHSVLHLLYSRFLTMALKDMNHVDFEEPFSTFRAHGLIIKDGAKMSKSKGNVVVPDEYIKKFGADSLRAYLMFTGPYIQGGDFRDSGIEGMYRFLKRVWRLVSEHSENSDGQKIRQSDVSDNQKVRSTESSDLPAGEAGFSERSMVMHRTIKKVTDDIANLRYNTAIAALMEYYNYLSSLKSQISTSEAKTLLLLLAPFAPHMTEELWQRLSAATQNTAELKTPKSAEETGSVVPRTISRSSALESIHLQPWPVYEEKYLESDEATIVVQVNGKLRDTITIQNSSVRPASTQRGEQAQDKNQLRFNRRKKEIEKIALESAKVQAHLEGKAVKKVVYVPGKLINFVIG